MSYVENFRKFDANALRLSRITWPVGRLCDTTTTPIVNSLIFVVILVSCCKLLMHESSSRLQNSFRLEDKRHESICAHNIFFTTTLFTRSSHNSHICMHEHLEVSKSPLFVRSFGPKASRFCIVDGDGGRQHNVKTTRQDHVVSVKNYRCLRPFVVYGKENGIMFHLNLYSHILYPYSMVPL